ncbi:zinc-dependent alcohol dehydrogenase [Rhodococcoides fascians]|uniref:zinc-dependent alcohol dehydrogenase n=1 Tax=Rhodococcoides fascians TaxID=1828 RepID=UPI001DF361DB|nr:zinc-dependent alcohol dehydrogenase [Rhodococcus fascians]CAH0149286.1 Alcohol dehydrogenase [Rhodococcus fascians]
MKAAVVTEFGGPLIVKDIPIPQPAPEQVLVKMETCGVCHTDIHAAQGDWPAKPTLPFVPGHEGIGVIEAVGSQVSKDRIGERVAIAWLGSACGECDHCVSGWETLCETQQNSGYSIDGAYAEYAVAHAKYVVHVPDGISSFDAAPLTCAGVTTYKAVKVGGVTPAQRVAIFGVGGLGHMAVQHAKIAGGFVTAVDIEDEKLDLAQELGADHTVNSATTDPVEAIQALGGADVAIVLAVIPSVFDQAFRSLRRGGRLVCVSMPAHGVFPIPIFETVVGGISVLGSIVGTRTDLREVFALHEAGRTTVSAVSRKLDEVNDCFDDLMAGRVTARQVFEF